MDKKNKKSPRKVHDINPQFEEENLWDLEDDWDETEAGQPSEEVLQEEAMEEEAVAIEESEPVEDDKGPATEEVTIEEQLSFDEAAEKIEEDPDVEPSEKAPLDNDDKFELEDLEDLDDSELEIQETEVAQDDAQEQPHDKAEAEESTYEPDTDIEESDTSSDLSTLVEPLKKLSLSSTEKIALSAIVVIFLGLTLWGIIWLKQKNNDATNVDTLELPITGEYATVSEFTTFWKAPGDISGIKLGAVVVPAAEISLGDDSSSGALRIYFRDASQNSIGDPITISFKDGKFGNGTNTVEVSASDGFHLKGDFHAYQMDSSLAWAVDVLEAESSSATRANFKKMFTTPVEPTMR